MPETRRASTIEELQSLINESLNNFKSEITLTINDAIKTAISQFRDEVKSLIQAELKNKIHILNKTMSDMKDTVVNQAIEIEKLKAHNSRKFAIVSGLPESENETNELESEAVAEFISNTGADIDISFKPFRLGKKQENKKRPLKIKFKSAENKRVAMDRNFQRNISRNENEKIYINHDLPYYTRKENARLRKRKFDLCKDKTDQQKSKIKILKGKLYDDEEIVDSFDLRHQVLQNFQ